MSAEQQSLKTAAALHLMTIAVLVACVQVTVVAAAEDSPAFVPQPVYLTHPSARAKQPPSAATAADRLAAAFLTPGIRLKHESTDVFRIPVANLKKIPGLLVGDCISTYSTRRGWPATIRLDAGDTVLDLAQPSAHVPDVRQLKKTVNIKSSSPTYDSFVSLLCGEGADHPDKMVRALMQTCFSRNCLHTRILQVGDGEQLSGFFVATLRTVNGKQEIVGMVIVTD